MKLICQSSQLEDYVNELEMVDYRHPLIRKKAGELFAGLTDEIEMVRTAFVYVRDSFPHSFDIQGSRVNCKASEVLCYGDGICYAKSHLLAGLLRSQGIPAGFCYQLLTRGDTPDTGYGIHAVNAVYLKTIARWIRLDARGNKPGVDAQFDLEQEKLAFPVRQEYQEEEYPVIYTEPNKHTITALRKSRNCQELYDNLPDHL